MKYLTKSELACHEDGKNYIHSSVNVKKTHLNISFINSQVRKIQPDGWRK
jgi:hypothetical protein